MEGFRSGSVTINNIRILRIRNTVKNNRFQNRNPPKNSLCQTYAEYNRHMYFLDRSWYRVVTCSQYTVCTTGRSLKSAAPTETPTNEKTNISRFWTHKNEGIFPAIGDTVQCTVYSIQYKVYCVHKWGPRVYVPGVHGFEILWHHRLLTQHGVLQPNQSANGKK